MHGADQIMALIFTYLEASFHHQNKAPSTITMTSGSSNLLQESGQELKLKARAHLQEVVIE